MTDIQKEKIKKIELVKEYKRKTKEKIKIKNKKVRK